MTEGYSVFFSCDQAIPSILKQFTPSFPRSVHCQSPAFLFKLQINAPVLYLALSLLSWPNASTHVGVDRAEPILLHCHHVSRSSQAG